METLSVERWLAELLGGDATLAALIGSQIYTYIAPREATHPHVIIQVQDGSDVRGVGKARIMTDLTMVVKAVDQAESFSGIEAIVNRVDALLQGAAGDENVLGAVRLQPLEYVEVIDGIQYRHLGGIYQVWSK